MVTRLIGLGMVYAIRPINARVARRLGALVSGSVRSLSLALPSILLEMEDSGDTVVRGPTCAGPDRTDSYHRSLSIAIALDVAVLDVDGIALA